ncbi:MAG: hypothetical protein AAGJ28_03795 [Pseudomonadota bacterium]
MLRVLTLIAALAAFALPAHAEMTQDRLAEIAEALDPAVEKSGNVLRFLVEDVPVSVVSDQVHNRMRVMVMVRSATGLSPDEMYRIMQANFDSALDARYAIAQNRLIAVFIHPLGSLSKEDFLSGIGQTVNLALTYGTTYTSGGLTYGGGDSNQLHRDLIDRLLKQGEKI